MEDPTENILALDYNRKLLAELKSYECRDATFHDQQPGLVLERALGSWVWDANGRKYLDMCAGFGALPLGHNDPRVSRAIASALSFPLEQTIETSEPNSSSNALPKEAVPWEQSLVNSKEFAEAPTIMHGLGDVHPSVSKIALLRKLRGVLPPHLTRGAFAVTGGQAVELAMKTAMLATGGTGFIAFKGGYHGLDLGALPLIDRLDFTKPFHGWISGHSVSHLDFGCDRQKLIDAIDEQTRAGVRTAAIIVEPIQGRAGTRLPPEGWLQLLQEIASQKGVLLVFDEIFTGLGRSGRITFAEEVACDILCLGKALGGGMPLSVCMGSEEVMDSWPESQGEAIHTGTFFGHPLSCLVGYQTLSLIVEDRLSEQASEKGQEFRSQLRSALEASIANGNVCHVRGAGMMTAIEFAREGDGAVMMNNLQKRGLMAIPSGQSGSCLALTPALNISSALLESAARLIGDTATTL